MGRHHCTAESRAAQPGWWRPAVSVGGLRWWSAYALSSLLLALRQLWWWSRPVWLPFAALTLAPVLSVVGALLGSFDAP